MDPAAFHRISKALADPRRFAILEQIAATAAGLACQALGAELPISKATLSHHLQELAGAGLIVIRKEGKFAFLKLERKTWNEYRRELRKRIG